ncbi:MAG: RDD family protein [Acidimicrobiales bacterium]
MRRSRRPRGADAAARRTAGRRLRPAARLRRPAGGPPAGQLAEWPDRALSGLIDYFGLAIIAVVIQNSISYGLGSLVWLLALGWGFYNGYLNGQTGRSVGKRVVGTKVVSEQTGQVIGGGQGVIRVLAHFLDGLICGIGYLFPLWDAKKQTIADKVMKTVVITGQPKESFGDAIKSGS